MTARESLASPPGRRSERQSYLFRRESAPFQEAGLTGPLAVVGGRGLPESLEPRLRRLFGPELVVLSDSLPGRRVVDAAPAKLFANSQRTVAAAAARVDVLLGESLLAQQSLRFERIERAFDRARIDAARGKLECKLAPRMLTARKQLESPRPELRFLLAGQASTASPASVFSAGPFRLGRSMSRSAVSSPRATPSFCLRNSRTLSRPWPIRSPL